MAETQEKSVLQSREYEIDFKVKVKVTSDEVEIFRKANRNFSGAGFFMKDKNVAQVLAFNKALELVSKQDNSVVIKIKSSETADGNFNV